MEIDNLNRLFNDFWYQKPEHLRVHNDSRIFKNFQKKICKCNSTEDLDGFIEASKTRRETMRLIAVAFYDFLRGKGMRVESKLDKIRFYDYPFERQLEIAKFLHEPHTNDEIANHFSIEDRTLRQDLEALRDGIEVLGTTIQIKEEKRGRKKYYKSTLHPIFLPLNLTEVYALTIYMPHVMERNNPNSNIICNISDRIKAQLSDYVLKRLFPDASELRGVSPELRYYDDERLAKSREGIIMYLMKSGETCSFYINGERKKGRIDLENGQYCLVCDDGKHLNVEPEKVEFKIDSLEYR